MHYMSNWELNEYELRLAEKIFTNDGVIFVGTGGTLFEKDYGDLAKVDSKDFDSFIIFIDEIRSAKIIVDMKSIMNG